MYNDKEEKRHFYKLVFSLVLPMAIQNLINVGVSTADVIMLGKVSEVALSASSLAGQVQFILSLILFGLTSGACVLTAQYWGKKEIRTIEMIMALAMRMALITATLFTIFVLIFTEPVMRIFTNDPEVVKQGVEYLRIISFSYVIMAVTIVYLNIMRSVERVIVSMLIYLISLIVNVILNAITIFGLFGIEPMGIRGAAIATLAARCVELLIVFFYARFRNREVRFHLRDLLSNDKLLRKDFITYSIPVMINELIWGTGTSVNAAIIGHLGTSVVAANSVMQVIRQLALVVAFGLANATAITLGKAIGEGRAEAAKLYAKRFVRLTLLLGFISIFVILGAAQISKNIMTLSDEAKSYLDFMTIIMSYFSFCQAYNTTLIVGVFRSGGDIKYGIFLDTFFMWCISIALGAVSAFILHLPAQVVYIILLSDEVIKIPFSSRRYRSMKWIKNITRSEYEL